MSSVKSRTIDNLGVESSVRYAKDKVALDSRLIEESRFIPQKTEVAVVKPYIATDFEEYLAPGKKLWATFNPPPDYFSYGKQIFSYHIMPSLGNSEQIQANIEKLEAMNKTVDKDPKEKKKTQALLDLLKQIHELDRTLNQINARRNQYQKG
jgi:hypothetical protein